MCYIEPYAASTTLSNKRSIARRIGTTYAYDFLGLIEKSLIADWSAAIKDGRHSEMPGELLQVRGGVWQRVRVLGGVQVVDRFLPRSGFTLLEHGPLILQYSAACEEI